MSEGRSSVRRIARRARLVDHDATLDGKEPRAQAAEVGVEAQAGLPGAQERLLHDFVGGAVITERASRIAVHLPAMGEKGGSQPGRVGSLVWLHLGLAPGPGGHGRHQ